jgi:type VI protein secretion system component VasF
MASLADQEQAVQKLLAAEAVLNTETGLQRMHLTERSGDNTHLRPIVAELEHDAEETAIAQEELRGALAALCNYVDEAVSSGECSPFTKRELKAQMRELKGMIRDN